MFIKTQYCRLIGLYRIRKYSNRKYIHYVIANNYKTSILNIYKLFNKLTGYCISNRKHYKYLIHCVTKQQKEKCLLRSFRNYNGLLSLFFILSLLRITPCVMQSVKIFEFLLLRNLY